MNVVTILHNKAMEFADEALLAKMEGKEAVSLKFFEKAFLLEKEAFDSIEDEKVDPFPKYILIRSAASLALNCGNYQEAERLIQLGLANGAPQSIKDELEELQGKLHSIKKELAEQQEQNAIKVLGIIIDANAKTNQITVQDLESKLSYTILVPQDLLNEIIKSYWADTVQIRAAQSDQGMVLEKIDRAA